MLVVEPETGTHFSGRYNGSLDSLLFPTLWRSFDLRLQRFFHLFTAGFARYFQGFWRMSLPPRYSPPTLGELGDVLLATLWPKTVYFHSYFRALLRASVISVEVEGPPLGPVRHNVVSRFVLYFFLHLSYSRLKYETRSLILSWELEPRANSLVSWRAGPLPTLSLR